MNPQIIIFDDQEFSVGMLATDKEKGIFHIAIKYNKPRPYKNKEGKVNEVTNLMGGETGWFILPHTFAVGIVKILLELKVSGTSGFNNDGFQKMIKYFVEMEDLYDGIGY